MFFNVRELELRKVPFDQEFPAGSIDFDSSFFRQIGAVQSRGVAELLSSTLGEIRIRGTVQGTFDASCDRCLEPIRLELDAPFDLFYRPAPDKDLPPDLKIDDGEAEIGFYEGLGIELEEILREFILLSVPMRQICQENCQGICPKCGQNRNNGRCDCVEETVGERWSALRAWKSAHQDVADEKPTRK